MTNEDLKKLERISDLIRKYEKYFSNIDDIKLTFGSTASYTDIDLSTNKTLVRKQEVYDCIYAAVKDTLDDLKEQYNSIVLCTKETETKYKPLEL